MCMIPVKIECSRFISTSTWEVSWSLKSNKQQKYSDWLHRKNEQNKKSSKMCISIINRFMDPFRIYGLKGYLSDHKPPGFMMPFFNTYFTVNRKAQVTFDHQSHWTVVDCNQSALPLFYRKTMWISNEIDTHFDSIYSSASSFKIWFQVLGS